MLLRNLKGRPPVSDVFGKAGLEWLRTLELGIDERETVDAGLRQLEFVRAELAHVDRTIAEQALGSAEIRRLMTVPGLDATTAAALMAAIGDVSRFPTPRHLVGYLGLDPRLRQSGVSKARQGRISKEGSAAAGTRSSSRRGSRLARRVHCAPSPSAPPPDVADTSPPSRSRASSPSSPGTS